MANRRGVILLILLAVLIAAVTSCPRGQQGPGGPGGAPGGMMGPPPVPVVVEPIMMQDYAPAIELVGEIRAAKQATMISEVAGKVMAIKHRVGEAHSRSAGTLIQIDPASYQAALDGANAQLAQAQQRLAAIENGPRVQEIAAQESRVAAARAQNEQAQDNLARQIELFEQDVVPESSIVVAQKQAEAAEAGLGAALEVLDAMLEGSRTEDIKSNQAAVALAQSGVDAAKLALARTSVVPAFDAIVADLMVEVGTSVAPGTPLCVVVSDEPAEAWFNLPEDQLALVQAGALVEIRLEAFSGEVLNGTVISISPEANAKSRQFPMRVALDDPRALAGMTAAGRILTAEPSPALMVKRDATTLTNLGQAVFVMQPAGPDAVPFMEGMPPLPTVTMKLVTTGGVIGDMVVIEGDLQPGMMVVTRGNESLHEGSSIIPTNLMGEGAMGGAPGGEMPPGMGDAPQGGMPPGMDQSHGEPAQGEGPPEVAEAPPEMAEETGSAEDK